MWTCLRFRVKVLHQSYPATELPAVAAVGLICYLMSLKLGCHVIERDTIEFRSPTGRTSRLLVRRGRRIRISP